MNVKEKESRITLLRAEQEALNENENEKYEALEKDIKRLTKEAYTDMTAWDTVYLARHPKRPKAQDYIEALFDNFTELHGDRCFGDDQALLAGIAEYNGIPVTILAQSKGSTLQENLERNFGRFGWRAR